MLATVTCLVGIVRMHGAAFAFNNVSQDLVWGAGLFSWSIIIAWCPVL